MAKSLNMRGVCVCVCVFLSSLAQIVKNLPAMWETQIQSLGQEDPLEKGISNILG